MLLRGRLYTATFLGNGRSGRVCDVTCGNVEFTWYSPTPGAVWRRRGMSRSNHVNTWHSPTTAVWRHRACAEICLPCWRLEAGCIHCCVTQQWVDISQYIVSGWLKCWKEYRILFWPLSNSSKWFLGVQCLFYTSTLHISYKCCLFWKSYQETYSMRARYIVSRWWSAWCMK
jgi:hypothetical protein